MGISLNRPVELLVWFHDRVALRCRNVRSRHADLFFRADQTAIRDIEVED